MAENKKSFIAYCDWLEVFDNLTDEEAGKLAKHLFNYVNDKKPKSDRTTELLFIQIKQSLKRDLAKYNNYLEKQRINGKKGGRPKNPTEPKKPKPFSKNPTEPKKADSVSVSDSVNVNVREEEENEKSSSIFRSIKEIEIDYLKNERVISAVLSNKNSPFVDRIDLEEKLSDFCDHLRMLDQTIKKEDDFKSHFLNWARVKKEKDCAQKEKPKRHKLTMDDLTFTKEDLNFNKLEK